MVSKLELFNNNHPKAGNKARVDEGSQRRLGVRLLQAFDEARIPTASKVQTHRYEEIYRTTREKMKEISDDMEAMAACGQPFSYTKCGDLALNRNRILRSFTSKGHVIVISPSDHGDYFVVGLDPKLTKKDLDGYQCGVDFSAE